ncbi:MAG: hypothetical protein V1928_00820 [Parcubacteria group bacterium]
MINVNYLIASIFLTLIIFLLIGASVYLKHYVDKHPIPGVEPKNRGYILGAYLIAVLAAGLCCIASFTWAAAFESVMRKQLMIGGGIILVLSLLFTYFMGRKIKAMEAQKKATFDVSRVTVGCVHDSGGFTEDEMRQLVANVHSIKARN